MRRVAASRVYINEKESHTNHVVELLDHSVVNHYALEGELPMTEWLGGTIIIRNRKAYHVPQVLSPEDILTISCTTMTRL
ncbi:MAG: hypothetical protein J5616_05255 [Bacteroidaceae bacterium]|nr:hypothetical protein [Bacteroidaceae bacterium]